MTSIPIGIQQGTKLKIGETTFVSPSGLKGSAMMKKSDDMFCMLCGSSASEPLLHEINEDMQKVFADQLEHKGKIVKLGGKICCSHLPPHEHGDIGGDTQMDVDQTINAPVAGYDAKYTEAEGRNSPFQYRSKRTWGQLDTEDTEEVDADELVDEVIAKMKASSRNWVSLKSKLIEALKEKTHDVVELKDKLKKSEMTLQEEKEEELLMKAGTEKMMKRPIKAILQSFGESLFEGEAMPGTVGERKELLYEWTGITDVDAFATDVGWEFEGPGLHHSHFFSRREMLIIFLIQLRHGFPSATMDRLTGYRRYMAHFNDILSEMYAWSTSRVRLPTYSYLARMRSTQFLEQFGNSMMLLVGSAAFATRNHTYPPLKRSTFDINHAISTKCVTFLCTLDGSIVLLLPHSVGPSENYELWNESDVSLVLADMYNPRLQEYVQDTKQDPPTMVIAGDKSYAGICIPKGWKLVLNSDSHLAELDKHIKHEKLEGEYHKKTYIPDLPEIIFTNDLADYTHVLNYAATELNHFAILTNHTLFSERSGHLEQCIHVCAAIFNWNLRQQRLAEAK